MRELRRRRRRCARGRPAASDRRRGRAARSAPARRRRSGRLPARRGDDERRPRASRRITSGASDERAAALGDQLEHAVEVRSRRRPRGRSPSSPRGGARRARARRGASSTPSYEASVLDRDRRPVGEDDDGLLVGRRRTGAALLLGQVQVPHASPRDEHRHAEERRHRRMVRREPVGLGWPPTSARRSGCGSWISTPSTPRPRGRSPIAALPPVDPAGDEARELAAVVVEDAERGVARARQLARDAQQLLEHRVELELRDQAAAGRVVSAASRRWSSVSIPTRLIQPARSPWKPANHGREAAVDSRAPDVDPERMTLPLAHETWFDDGATRPTGASPPRR